MRGSDLQANDQKKDRVKQDIPIEVSSPSKYVVDAILVSDFEHCDSDLDSEDIDRTAKAGMEKVADEAIVDKE